MPPLFWTGELSPVVKLLVNLSCLAAWVTGNARDMVAMKQRMRLGYEGTCTNHVTRYDTLGLNHFARIATELLGGIDLQEKQVLDVGCGTGILSLQALSRGAGTVLCTDLSRYMLEQCRQKAARKGIGKDRIDFRTADAESLPFDDNRFDAVISSMMFGLVPNQPKVLSEMIRVLKPSGLVAISSHGPGYYHEAIDATIRSTPLRYAFGYRFEFWPQDEGMLQQMLNQSGYTDIHTRRITWQDNFPDGGKAYDFFTATSACWWSSKLPPKKIPEITHRNREYFKRKNLTRLTEDIILTFGRKPENEHRSSGLRRIV